MAHRATNELATASALPGALVDLIKSKPEEFLLLLAYFCLLYGASRRADSGALRSWTLTGNFVFVLVGWTTGLWSMIIANAALILLHGSKLTVESIRTSHGSPATDGAAAESQTRTHELFGN